MSTLDDQLAALPPVQSNLEAHPSALEILSERLKQLPAPDVSLQELVEKLSKKEGN